MKYVGIVAEYNPFHKGHEYMLRSVRDILGEDTAVICVMSGSFAQRGECAMLSKHARAEAAVKCGADLVLELPLPWALSSAELFARGAVRLLAATGVLTHLAFGSESADLSRLSKLAGALLAPDMDERIKDELALGLSYAAARQRAVQKFLGEDAALLSSPNDILAVEYLKALQCYAPSVQPLAIPRVGAGHDQEGEFAFLSASDIRRRVIAGEEFSGALPREMAGILAREIDAGRAPMSVAAMEMALLSRLRMLPPEAFALLPDSTEGLDKRLYSAVHEGADLQEILALAKSKRYAMARLRRMLMCAALGLRADDREGMPPYLRVLALSERGRRIWREMDKTAQLPKITRPGEVKMLDERAQHLFALEAAATDLLSLACTHEEDRRPGREWRCMPYVFDR